MLSFSSGIFIFGIIISYSLSEYKLLKGKDNAF